MEVIFDNKSAMHGVLTFQFEQAEIKTETDKKLKQVARTASVKGFRPGKVPPAVLSKLYGKEMRYEAINKLLEGALQNFLEKEREKVLFSPIMATSPTQDELMESDILNFTFDLVLKPEFALPEGNFTYEKFTLAPTAEDVDDLIKDVFNSKAKSEEVETVGENSTVMGDFHIPSIPLKDEITITVTSLASPAKEELLGKKIDDVYEGVLSGFFLDIKHAELILGPLDNKTLEEGFAFKITKITDQVPPEVNEALHREVLTELGFIKPKAANNEETSQAEGDEGAYAEEVKEGEEVAEVAASSESEEPVTEAFFREKMTEYLVNEFANTLGQAEENAIYDQLMASVQISFDDEILVKYMKAQSEDENLKEVTPRDLELMKRSLKGMLLTNKIVDTHNIEVTEAEILDYATLKLQEQFRGWGVNLPYEQVRNLAPGFLDRDKGKSYDEYKRTLTSKKCIDFYRQRSFTAVEKVVSVKEFNEVIKKMNEAFQEEQNNY